MHEAGATCCAGVLAASRLAVLKALGVPELAELAREEVAYARGLRLAYQRSLRAAWEAALPGPRSPGGEAGVKRFVEAVGEHYAPAFEREVKALAPGKVERFYRLGKVSAWRKALGYTSAVLRMPPAAPLEKAAGGSRAELKASFDLVDDDAVSALLGHQLFWAGGHYEAVVNEGIAFVARDIMVEQGLSGAEAGKELAAAIGDTVGTPHGWQPDQYFRVVASNAATVGRVMGAVKAFEDLGVTRLVVVNPRDEVTCERCRLLDGQVFDLSVASAQKAKLLAVKHPSAIKGAVAPWFDESEFRHRYEQAEAKAEADAKAAGKAKPDLGPYLAAQRICLPPYHGSCRCTVDVEKGAQVKAPGMPAKPGPPPPKPPPPKPAPPPAVPPKPPAAAKPPPAPKPAPPPPKPTPPPGAFPWAESELTAGPPKTKGAHEGYFYRAPDGSEWLFKPVPEQLAVSERVACHDLAVRLGLPGPDAYAVRLRGKPGVVQRLFPGVKGDLEGMPFEQLTESDTDTILREAAYNWLIGENDGHAGNWLRLADGRLVGIDKGQAFKFYNADKLDWDYHPNTGFHGGQYDHLLLRAYAQGQGPASIDPARLPQLAAFLDRVEALPDEEFLAILRPMAVGLHAASAGKPLPGVFGQKVGWSVDQFLEEALRRKKGLRRDFLGYLERAQKERNKALGVQVPAAATRRARQAAATVAEPGVVTPLNAEWVRKAKASGWRGRTMFLGGQDWEDMQAVGYTLEDGTFILEGKLREDGNRRLVDAILSRGIAASTSESGGALTPSEFRLQALAFAIAKHTNHHFDPASLGYDQKINLNHKANATEAWRLIRQMAKSSNPDERAAAKHYADYLGGLLHWDAEGNPTWKEKPKLASAGHKLVSWADAPQRHGLKGPPTTFRERPVNTPSRRFRPDGPPQATDEPPLEWGGKMYEGHLAPGVQLRYVPWSSPGAFAGRIELVLDKAEATPAGIEAALVKLRELGVECRLADKKDLRLLYLRKTTRAAKLEGYVGFSPKEDRPVDEQIKELHTAWSRRLGRPPEQMPGYQEAPTWDHEEFDGRPRWLRFDVSDEDIAAYQEEGYTIAQSINALSGGGHLDNKIGQGHLEAILRSDSLLSSCERMRVGIYNAVSRQGESVDRDVPSGGAAYVFTRLRRWQGRGAPPFDLEFDLRLWRDCDAIHYSGDMFGQTVRGATSRRINGNWEGSAGAARSSPDNELDFKSRVGMLAWLRAVHVRSKESREAVLDLFRKLGIKRVRGRPIEALVKVGG